MSKKETLKDFLAQLANGEIQVRKTWVGNKKRRFYIYKHNNEDLFDKGLSESMAKMHLSELLKDYIVATIIPASAPKYLADRNRKKAEKNVQHDNEPNEPERCLSPATTEYFEMSKLKIKRLQGEVLLLFEQLAVAKREKYKMELDLLKLELELGLTQRSAFTEHIIIAPTDDENQ